MFLHRCQCFTSPTRCYKGAHTVIKPIPEAVKPMLYEVFCSSEVEPGIDYSGSVFDQTIATGHWKAHIHE